MANKVDGDRLEECELCGMPVERTMACEICGMRFCRDCGDFEKGLCNNCLMAEPDEFDMDDF